MGGNFWEDDGDRPGQEDLTLSIRGVAASPADDQGVMRLVLQTTRGEIEGAFHVVEGSEGAAIFVGGAMGGIDGPAKGMWNRVAEGLVGAGVSALRLDYRQPNEFAECVLDVLAGASFLKGIGASSVIAIGHSFGGAVVVRAGGIAEVVSAVASLSPQLYGTWDVDKLGKPLLLVHGAADTILHHEASEEIYRRAEDPKELVLFAETGHALLEAAGEIEELLVQWIVARVGSEAAESGRREIRPSIS